MREPDKNKMKLTGEVDEGTSCLMWVAGLAVAAQGEETNQKCKQTAGYSHSHQALHCLEPCWNTMSIDIKLMVRNANARGPSSKLHLKSFE